MRIHLDKVLERLHKPLKQSDIRAIKDGLVDHMAINKLDPKDIHVGVDLMKEMLGRVMLLSEDWVCMHF